MAGRFKAASLCRSCEKRASDRHRGARCVGWLRLLGTAVKGCPRSGFVPVAQGYWQKWKWKRSYYSTDEVPREKKKTAPCWTCPLLRPLLPPGWHRPRGRLHLFIVSRCFSQKDTQTLSHETVRPGARSLCPLDPRLQVKTQERETQVRAFRPARQNILTPPLKISDSVQNDITV